MKEKLEKLQEMIGYQFKDPGLLTHALTHSSYANEKHWDKTRCNERLEFLGDAVLEVISSDFLFHTYESMPEGEMTKKRASLVCEPALAFCARDLDLGEYLASLVCEPTLAYCADVIPLGDYLLLGKGEDLTGGRKRPSVVSDAMEAVIGAIYLDGGLANAKEFIHRFILNDIEHKQLFYDSKTILQEIVQSNFKEPVSYELLGEKGPDHNKVFEVAVRIGDDRYGVGFGRTKKAAEQEAAYQSILALRKKNIE